MRTANEQVMVIDETEEKPMENNVPINANTVEVINEQEVLGKNFRMYGTVDSPLFLAKDVAEWIDYSKNGSGSYKISQMLATVDVDEKLMTTIQSSGQNREMWFLTEDGLYEVLMQSCKPIAKAFKKQVKAILKEIRKTGVYVAKAMDSYMIADPIERAKAWIKEEEHRIALDAEVKELKPKAEQTEKFIEHGHLIGFRDLAKELHMKETRLHMIVEDILKWRYKSGKKYVPYKSTVENGFMAAYDSMNDDNGWTGVGYGFTIAGRMGIEKENERLKNLMLA